MSSEVQEMIGKLTQDPGNVELLADFDVACVEHQEWALMASTLASSAPQVDDPIEQARFLLRAVWAGGHASVSLPDQSATLSVLAELSLDYEALATALRRAFLIDSDWGALAETAVWVAQHAPVGLVRAQLEYFAGRVFEDRLHDNGRAIKLYRGAWKASGGLFVDPLPAARSLLARSGEWKHVLSVFHAQIQHTSDPRARARLLVESGRVLMNHLGQREQGLEALQQALALDPDLESIRAELAEEGVLSDEAAQAVSTDEEPVLAVMPGAVVEESAAPVEVEVEVEVIESLDEADAEEPVEALDADAEADEAEPTADGEMSIEELSADEEPATASSDDERESVDAASTEEDAADAAASDEEAPEEEAVEPPDLEAAVVVTEEASAPVEDAPSVDAAAADMASEGGIVPPPLDAPAETDDEAAIAVDEAADDVAATDAPSPDDLADARMADEGGVEAPAADADDTTAAPEEAAGEAEAADADASDEAAADADASAADAAPVEVPDGAWAWQPWAPDGEDRARTDRALAALASSLDPDAAAARIELMSWTGASVEAVEDLVLECLLSADDTGAAARTLLATLSVHRDLTRRLALRLAEEAADEATLAGAAYAFALYGCGDEDTASRFRGHLGPIEAAEAEAVGFLQKGNWRKAGQATEAALQEIYGDAAEVEGYRRQGLLAVGFDQVEKIFDAARRATRKDKSEMTLRRLSRNAALTLDRWPQVIEGFKAEAELETVDGPLRAAWLGRMLAIYRDELKQDLLVMQTSAALVEVEPDNVALMDRYAELLESMNRFPDLLDLLRKKAEVMPTDAEKVAVLETLATWLTERISNPQEAMRVYEEIRALEPQHVGAMEALDGLYEARREWTRLIELKRERVAVAQTIEEKVAILRQGAELAATRMRDIPLAIALWEEVLSEDPHDMDALEALEMLHEREKDQQSVADVLARRVPLIEDVQAKQAALLKLGVLLGDKLNRAEEAVAAWEELLQLDPEQLRAREALKKGYVELQRWDDLEALFASMGAWQDYARQLDMAIQSLDDESTQLDLLFRSARVWTDELEMPERAVKSYEKILQLDASNREAAKAVLPFFEERRDYRRLPSLLEVVLEGAEAPEERFACQRRLGEIYAEPLRDPSMALHWFGEALRTQPTTVELTETLEAQADAASAWQDLEALYRECLDALDPADGPAWRTLSLRLAAACEVHLGNLDDALAVLDDVLTLDGEDRDALQAKDRIHVATGAWDELLDVVETWFRLEASTDGQIAQLVRLAEIHESGRGDLAAAIETQERILALRDGDENALEALDRLHEQTGDAHALRGVLERRITLADQAEASEAADRLRLRLADVLSQSLEEMSAAVDVLSVLVDHRPEDGEVVERLEALLESPEVRHRVATMLDPLLALHEQWRAHVDVLEVQLESLHETPARVGILARMAQTLVTQLGEREEAMEVWSRVLREDPHADAALEALEGLAEALDAWSHPASLYEDVMEAVAGTDVARAVALGDRCATLVDQRLGDADEAIRLHERVLSLQPGRLGSLLALDNLFDRTAAWEELLRNLERRLDVSEDPATIRELRFRMAGLCDEQLEDPSRAVPWMVAARDADPADQEALEALDRLYGVLEDAQAQVEVLHARLQLRSDDAAATQSLKSRLAALYEAELSDPLTAISLWSEMLAADPDDLGAQASLQRQLEQPELVEATVAVLEPFHVQREAWDALVELLEVQLAVLGESPEGYALLERIATLEEQKLEDTERAWSSWLRGVRWSLSHAAFVEALYRLAPDLGRWEELADTLQALAREEVDPQLVKTVLVGVAEVRENKLADQAGAASIWTELLDNDPFDGDALNALERLLEPLARWEPLVDVLLRKADTPQVVSDASARQPLLYRAAELQEMELGQRDEAIEVLQTLLRDDPSQSAAIASLERLFADTERWEEWVENRERAIALASDDSERRSLLFGLAETLEVRLEDPDRAIAVLQRVLGMDATDAVALREVGRLHETTENWFELLQVLRQQVDLEADEGGAVALRYRVAGLLDREMMDISGALAEYRAILAIDATHQATREALWALVHRGDEAKAAAAMLEPLWIEEEAWEALLALWAQLVEQAELPGERCALYRKIAEVQEVRIGDLGEAWEATAAAARQELSLADVETLERLAAPADRWAQTASLLGEVAEEVVDPALRTDLGLRMARIQETELADEPAAIATLVRVHDEDPQQEAPLESLERLYRQSTAWEALAEVLEKRAFLQTAPDEARRCRLARAEVLAAHLGEYGEALQIYRELLSADPSDTDALAALEGFVANGIEIEDVAMILEPLHRAAGRWAALVGLHQARIAAESVPEERHRLWLEVAEVQEHSLHAPADALQALGFALVEMPSDEPLRDRVESLAASQQAWNEAWAIYHEVLQQEDLEEADRFDVSLRLARILEEHVGDPQSAEAVYRVALDLEPEDDRVLSALDRLLTVSAAWTELEGILRRRREVVFEPDALGALTERHARLLEQELGDAAGAVEVWQERLDQDGTSAVAMTALHRLHRQRQDWESLYDICDRRSMAVATDEERVPLWMEMADLAATALGQPDDAIDLWNRVLHVQPEDDRALAELAALLEATERFAELCDVLRQQAARASDEAQRLALLLQLAWRLAEDLQMEDAAAEAYREVLAVEPANANALMALRVLHERSGDSTGLAGTIERLLEAGLVEEHDRLSTLEELGRLYQDVLMQPQDAVRTWNMVRAIDPGHGEALERLDALLQQTEAWEPLADVILARAATGEEGEEQLELLRRVAHLFDHQIQDAERAVEAWERVVDLDLTDTEGLTRLESLYAELGLWEAFAGLLVDRIEVIEDEFERLETLRRAAEIYEQRLGQPEGAWLLIKRALSEAPLDEALLVEAERLAEAAGQWEDLTGFVGELVQHVASHAGEEQTLPLVLMLGRAQRDHLGRPDMAEIYFDRALGLDPDNEVALEALDGIYTTLESWDDLARVLRRRAELVFEPDARLALLRRAARTSDTHGSDPDGAITDWLALWDADETDAEAPDALERLYTSHARWEALVELLDRRAASTMDAAQQRALRVRIGVVLRDEVGSAPRAIEAFEDVLAMAPDDIEVLESLEALYLAVEDWDRYVENLEAQLHATASDARGIALHRALALVAETKFDDVDRALEAHRRILGLAPGTLESITEMERILEEQGRVYELVEVQEQHVAAVTEDADRIEVLGLMVRAIAEFLEDAPRAITVCERILALDAGHRDTLLTLAALHERTENVNGAVAALDRLAELSADSPESQADALHRAAVLLLQLAGDADGASRRLMAALEAVEDHIPSLDALIEVQLATEAWGPAITTLERRIERTHDLGDRARLLVQIGEVHELQLGNAVEAQRLYEEAIDLDPNNVFAAAPLAEMYIAAERWERVKPMLELLVREGGDQMDAQQMRALYLNLGRACGELELDHDALGYFQKALELSPGDVEALTGMAHLLYRREDFEGAYRAYIDLLQEHGASMAVEQVVEALYRAGSIAARREDNEEATSLLEQAVERDPTHEPSLRALLPLQEAAGKAAAVVTTQRRLVEVTSDSLEKFSLLVRIGDTLVSRDPDGAVEAYRAAVAIDDASIVVLTKLLQVFMQQENWRRAVEVLGRMAEVEQDPKRSSKFFLTLARILADEIEDPDKALRFFDAALDKDVHNLEAFSSIDQMLTERRDWKELERAYRRMVERVRSAPDRADLTHVEFTLYKNLGEIYRSRLNQLDHAIAAFKLAAELQPEEAVIHQILADLYQRTGTHLPELIAAHRRMIAISPVKAESYEVLFRAYLNQGNRDGAWCIASALQVVKPDFEEARLHFRKYAAHATPALGRAVTDEHWRQLQPEGFDELLSRIYAVLAVHLRSMYAVSLKDWRLNKRRDAIDLREPMPLTKELQTALAGFRLQPVALYAGQDYAGLGTMNTDPWAIVAGGDVLSGRQERELRFLVGRAVAQLRPEYFLASVANTDLLKDFLLAAIGAFTQQIPAVEPERAERIRSYVGEIVALPAPVRAQLQQPVDQLRASGRNPNVSTWMTHVDQTVSRAGLLLCGDVRTACTLVRSESRPIGKATPEDKVRELLLYSISEPYLTLREELGLSLDARGQA